MKIYKIPVDEKFRPDHQDFMWPPQNRIDGWDFGVEQDFEWWLEKHPSLIADKPTEADWLYIPIYWNRYYINTIGEDGCWGGGVEALGEEVDRVLYDVPTFTISEADIKWLKPQINWRHLTIFCASRRDENGGIDIPLLSAPHAIPNPLPEKKYLASFMGNLRTDAVRMEMEDELKDHADCRVEHANVPMEEFAQVMLESYIALSPRGQGAQSYRMYEAMQLGVVPWYISNLDCRPFYRWIDWLDCSIMSEDVIDLNGWLRYFKNAKQLLINKGKKAKEVYDCHLGYQKWEYGVLKELELL
jgi:hypothetical protein